MKRGKLLFTKAILAMLIVGCNCTPKSGNPSPSAQIDSAKAKASVVEPDSGSELHRDGNFPSMEDEKSGITPMDDPRSQKKPLGKDEGSIRQDKEPIIPKTEELRRRWFVEDSLERVKWRTNPMPPTNWHDAPAPKKDTLKGK